MAKVNDFKGSIQKGAAGFNSYGITCRLLPAIIYPVEPYW
jgi:hypothetical protein